MIAPVHAASGCDQAEEYDLGGAGEGRAVVDEVRNRRAPDLPTHHLQRRAIAVKVVGPAILAVACIYRASYILSLVPQPYRSALCAAGTAVGLFFCVIGPKVAAVRRDRE